MEVKIESAEDYFAGMYSDDHEVRRSAVTGEAEAEVWEAALRDYPDRHGAVALNKNLPVEILDALARDNDPRIRRLIAQKRRLSEATFNLLAETRTKGCDSFSPETPSFPTRFAVFSSRTNGPRFEMPPQVSEPRAPY
jgi:hypothetical protein